jgi:hypothetical protein
MVAAKARPAYHIAGHAVAVLALQGELHSAMGDVEGGVVMYAGFGNEAAGLLVRAAGIAAEALVFGSPPGAVAWAHGQAELEQAAALQEMAVACLEQRRKDLDDFAALLIRRGVIPGRQLTRSVRPLEPPDSPTPGVGRAEGGPIGEDSLSCKPHDHDSPLFCTWKRRAISRHPISIHRPGRNPGGN